MNIYADRGNLLLLERRCAWRGIGFEVTAATLGDAIDPDAHDLFYLGGGQDRDQRLCAFDLVDTKRDALHAAAAAGRIVLGVCGGYQLLGHAYELGDERDPRDRPGRPRTVREDGPAADRQRRHRGRAAGPGRPARARRLREPRRPHAAGRRRARARAGAQAATATTAPGDEGVRRGT